QHRLHAGGPPSRGQPRGHAARRGRSDSTDRAGAAPAGRRLVGYASCFLVGRGKKGCRKKRFGTKVGREAFPARWFSCRGQRAGHRGARASRETAERYAFFCCSQRSRASRITFRANSALSQPPTFVFLCSRSLYTWKKWVISRSKCSGTSSRSDAQLHCGSPTGDRKSTRLNSSHV